MRPRLFVHIVGMEARKIMSYRGDFWINASVGILCQYTLFYCLWSAVYAAEGARADVGGFDRAGMMAYAMLAVLFSHIVRSGNQETVISREIYDGSLTRFLLYPIRYMTFKYAQCLGAMLPVFMQMAFFLLVFPLVFGVDTGLRWSPAAVGMTGASLLAANFLFFVMRASIELVAFWAEAVWSLLVTLRFACYMLGGFYLPLTMFPEGARAVLKLTPFPYLFFQPVQAAMGRLEVGEWLFGLAVMAAWIVAFAFVYRMVWRRGDRQYTGVGI